ncbi:hypothetical protein Cgig2_011601 [Carnegiea gigantea]|uniref:DUF4283 domain-containing protein n=1 Tax=Carnegiea gigantea TaxID=171969 RepID=A0A9Q1GH29_9CARY|nr:hypothetical protein Cgig2_011601 [Carnegiea gigantea]
MNVMNQKSVLSIVIANPPRRTTVAHLNPRVPSPVAAFSRMARRRAKRVSFFSGARSSGLSEVNGTKCAKITPKDVYSELEYWQTSVICSVLGANPPLEVMEGFLRRFWHSQTIDKIGLVKNGLFLVHFHNMDDQLLVVKKGNPELDLQTETLTFLPMWVQFHELELKY